MRLAFVEFQAIHEHPGGYRFPSRSDAPRRLLIGGQSIHHRRTRNISGEGGGAPVECQCQVGSVPPVPRQRQPRVLGARAEGLESQPPLLGERHAREYVVKDGVAAEHGCIERLHLLQRDRFHRPARAHDFDHVPGHGQLALGPLDGVVAVNDRVDHRLPNHREELFVGLDPPRSGTVDGIGQLVAQPLQRLPGRENLGTIEVPHFLPAVGVVDCGEHSGLGHGRARLAAEKEVPEARRGRAIVGVLPEQAELKQTANEGGRIHRFANPGGGPVTVQRLGGKVAHVGGRERAFQGRQHHGLSFGRFFHLVGTLARLLEE